MHDYIPRKIDINEQIEEVVVRQYDNMSRFLHVRITDKDLNESGESAPFDMTGCEARLYVEISETDSEYVDGEIADGEDGVAVFYIPSGVTQNVGTYHCVIRITNAEDQSAISTKPFVLRVEEAGYREDAFSATSEFSAFENTLFQVALNKARIEQLTNLIEGGGGVSGEVNSEVMDIRTAYDGTTYTTAGDAVRAQVQELKDSVATNAEFLSVVGGDYEENEEAEALISDLQASLEEMNAMRQQFGVMNRQIESISVDTANQINKLRQNCRTLEMYGAVGDGATDDTEAIQNAFDVCGANGYDLQGVSGKTYVVSDTIKVTSFYFNFNGNGCTFKGPDEESSLPADSETIPIFEICTAKAQADGSTLKYTNRYAGEFGNFVLDLNNQYDGIRVLRDARRLKSRIKIVNPYQYGIYIPTIAEAQNLGRTDSYPTDSSSDYKNIYIEADLANVNIDNTVGVIVGSADCYFSTVDMVNTKTMWDIRTTGNVMLDHCHGFMGTDSKKVYHSTKNYQNIYEGAVYMHMINNSDDPDYWFNPTILLNQCYIDNVQYGFKLEGQCNPRVQMIGCYQYTATNSSAVTEEMLKNMKLYLIHTNISSNITNRFNLIGCTLFGSQMSGYSMDLSNFNVFKGVIVGCQFAGSSYMNPTVNNGDYSSSVLVEYSRSASFTITVKNQLVDITGDITYNPAEAIEKDRKRDEEDEHNTIHETFKILDNNILARITNADLRPPTIRHFMGYAGTESEANDKMAFTNPLAITVTPDGYIRMRGLSGSDSYLFGSADKTYHIVFSASWCINA